MMETIIANWTEEVQRWVDHACLRNNVPELRSRINIVFQDYEKRIDSEYNDISKRGVLRIDITAWYKIPRSMRRDFAIEQICYLIAAYGGKGAGRTGSRWRKAMANCEE